MKPRTLHFFPRTLMVCVAPLLGCAAVKASVMTFNESNSTGVWTVPSGTNLLTAAVATSPLPASPANTPAVHEASSGTWATLSDGILGTPGGTVPPYKSQTVTPGDGDSVTYALDLSVNPEGYDITSLDSYCIWGDGNRDNQNFVFQYSTDGVNFTTVAVVDNRDSINATHTRLADTTGVLATGVKFVKFIFGGGGAAGQENGYVGYSEFKLLAAPTNVTTQLESNTSNSWTLPAGTNLLNGASAIPSTLPANEGSSPNWSTVTNGILGAPGDNSTSVTARSNTSVIFPLNTSVNINGYNISSFDSYCAWINGGRDNQDLAISYSTVDDSSTFIPIATADIRTPVSGGDNATHMRLTPVSGFLATRVHSIKINFAQQENGYVGYREFIALGTAVSISDPLTWTGGTNGTWSPSPVSDSNWKKTTGGVTAPFNSLAPLTFDNTGTNASITVSAPLTASSMAFINGGATPYTFDGSALTVSNDVVSSDSGSATFNNAVKTATGVTLSGSGSLAFNGALESTGLILSGSGGITLNAANPAFTGSAAVSDGTLTVSHDNGLQNAGLAMTGGISLFTSSAPHVGSISSLPVTPGLIVLGKTAGPVNTHLTVGDAASSSFAGAILEASGTTGSLTKTGAGSLSLSGDNTYTGTTTVSGGTLQLTQRLSLYHGTTASWTASNLIVGSGGTLGFNFGDFDEFTDTDLNSDLSLGGFQPGSSLGIHTFADLTLSRNLTQPGLGLVKTGPAILSLTGINTSSGMTRIFLGTINAASTGGTSIGGNVLIGNGSGLVYLNMGAGNQFAADSVVTFANQNFYNATMNLRGTSQTIAGLDAAPFPVNKITIVQNDEIGHPGYTVAPGEASLTIDAATDHSFKGIIRNQSGGALSLTKNGPGTQELVNLSGVADYQYTGPTTINQGKLKISFSSGNNGFSSNVIVNSPSGVPAELFFHAVTGDLGFDREISGAGHVAVDGVNAVRLTSNNNSWSGGTSVGRADTIYYGYLALIGNGGAGAGTALGQNCAGGAMIPSNLITVHNGATLALDGIAPLGNSTVLPEFAPSVRITENSTLSGGNSVAFVSNITLDGGKIEITSGGTAGGFNTNLTFVGTLTVGGSSTVPAEIKTVGTGANANASLGSGGLPGTIFQVADVTSGTAVDLTVSSNLRNVGNAVSPLTKTGPGTMMLSGTNTYTGTTRVSEGVLRIQSASEINLANGADVVIDAAGTLDLQFSGADTISRLTLAGTQVAGGFYGSNTNTTPGINHTPLITGPGMLFVSLGPVTDPYALWSAQITAGDSSRAGDPDGDGFTNLQEYLFGTSPNTANGSLSAFENTPSGLIVRWNQRATTGTYVLRESATMSEPVWPVSPATITNSATQDLPDYVRKEALVPIDSARKFVRVQGTE